MRIGEWGNMLSTGQKVDERYTVQRVLGEGGMGTVYEVTSDTLGHRLAMKVINPRLVSHDAVVARFRREASIQATVSHPGITRVFDLVDRDGLLAIIMEYVGAPTLREIMDRGAMDPTVVRRISADLLSILAACHQHGVAHRDLKPENVFVERDATGGSRCKLADFGVAKMLDADTEDGHRTKAFVGTYAYASPEQITASGEIDGRSDLYSLGVMIWEMLCGLGPYADQDSSFAIQVAVVQEPLPDLPASVPADLRHLVAELTRKERTARPQDASEALRLLRIDADALDGTTISEASHIGPPQPATSAAAAAPRVPSSEPPPLPHREASPALTEWDPPQEQVVPPKAPPPSRPATPSPVGLGKRLLARTIDEALLALLALSCVGILLFPVAALLRGVFSGRGTGGTLLGAQLHDVRTGAPARGGRVALRNLVDLLTFQLGLGLLFWTGGLTLSGGILNVVGLLWAAVFVVVELAVAVVHPDGRRLADLIAGTRSGKPRE